MKKLLTHLMLLCVGIGAWAQGDSYAGTWYLQEVSTGKFAKQGPNVSSWASELSIKDDGTTFQITSTEGGYYITTGRSGSKANFGCQTTQNGDYEKMFDDIDFTGKPYTIEKVAGGVVFSVNVNGTMRYMTIATDKGNALSLRTNRDNAAVFKLLSSNAYTLVGRGAEVYMDFDDVTAWYKLTLGSSKKKLSHHENQTAVPLSTGDIPVGEESNYAWGFLTTATGVKIVNNAAGKGRVLANPTGAYDDGNTGANTRPIMKEEANLSGDVSEFAIDNSTSISGENGFFIRMRDSNGSDYSMNDRNNILAYWTGGRNDGSTFLVERIHLTDVYEVTYHITNAYGEIFDVVVPNVEAGATAEAPVLEYFSNAVIAGNNHIVADDNKEFSVTGNWSFPVEEGKYYTMRANSNNFVYNGTNAYCDNRTAAALDNDKWSFEHVPNSQNLFMVKNEQGGYATVANANNQALFTFSDTPTEWTSGTGTTSYFRITKNGAGFNLQHPGNAQANAGNHVGSGLGFWTNASSSTHAASRIFVTEAVVSLDNYKAGASTIVDAWPLASQTVKDNAKSAISEATDKAGVNTALADGYTAYNTEISTKYYHIKSAYPGYQTNQHVDKAFIAGDSKVTWGTFDAGSPYQYFQITVTTNGYYNIKSYKVDKYMTATNGTLGASATNNTIFKSLGDDQYNITVGSGNPCHTEGHSEGAGVSGNLVTWPGDANSCSAWKFIETTAQAYEGANAKTINYTITDAAGTQYTGSYRGGRGEMPPFTGVTGQTYQNAVWGEDGDNLTLTANITFPFPVSKAGTDNWTYIAGRPSNAWSYWYAEGVNVKASKNILPTNETGVNDKYKWAIYPSKDGNAFSFKIKNAVGGNFVYTTSTSNNHAEGTVTVAENGSSFTYNGGFVVTGTQLLSVPSSTDGIKDVGTNTAHSGTTVSFQTPTDFDALMAKLNQYVIGAGIGKYNTAEDNATKIAAVKAGTQFATVAEFTAMINACTINQPAAGYYYFKGTASGHYITTPAEGTQLNSTATTPTDANIFQLTEDHHLIPLTRNTLQVKVGDGLILAEEDGLTVEFIGSPTMPGSYNIKVSGTSNYFYDWTTFSTSKVLVNGEQGHTRCQWTLEDAVDWAGLQTIVDEARSYPLGDGLGKYRYLNSFGLDMTEGVFVSMLETIEADLNGSRVSTYSDVEYYKANLREMIDGLTLNMPTAGKFYRLKATNDRYMCSDPAYGGQNDPEVYSLKVKEGNEKTTIFHLTTDGHLIAYATGTSVSWGWKTTLVGADHDCTWTISEAENVIGKYAIKCPDTATWANLIYIGYNNDTHVTREGSQNGYTAWEIEEVTEIPVTIGTTKFATFYTPVELQVPSGVTAYVCNLDGENLAMYTCKQTDGEHTLIPAGTAVMLNAPEQAEATSYGFVIPATAQAEAYSNNSFFGSVATKAFATDYTYYSLQRDNAANDGTVGFFIKPSGNFKGFQAFLKTENSQQVQRFNVTFDEDAVITGLANVLGSENITIPAYDLSGRKVDANTHRGLYIMNGKKVIR